MFKNNLYSTVPLSRAVKAAAIDAYEELSRVEERYSHWAVRVLRKLNTKTIKANRKRVLINVAKSTKIAMLPYDVREVSFLGFLDEMGRKVQIPIDPDIYGDFERVPESCCSKCGQPKAICEALDVTVETSVVTPVADCDCYYRYGYYYYVASNAQYGYGYACGPIGGGVDDVEYVVTTTKRLLPNGDYIEDTRYPIYDPQACTVRMASSRRLVQSFDLNECGCIAPTKSNADKMLSCSCDVYNMYFNNAFDECGDVGARIFLEDGCIKFSGNIDFDKVFIEYYGDLTKKNGEFVIPEVALETVVAGIHEKRLAHKNGATIYDKDAAKKRFKDEKRDMMQVIGGRITVFDIIEAATQIPVI